jgi:hypothetical protein
LAGPTTYPQQAKSGVHSLKNAAALYQLGYYRLQYGRDNLSARAHITLAEAEAGQV